MKQADNIKWFFRSLMNSYSQVFFSDNIFFAAIIILVTFIDVYTGLFGLFSVLVTNAMAYWIGFDKFKIRQGYYGFNSLLVGLGLGIYFQPGALLMFIVLLAVLLTLFISVSMEGVIGKYALPYLSIPFVISLWILTLASREFQTLGLNERGIYTMNDLYLIGGNSLVNIYNWWNAVPILVSVKVYFLSLGAIFFQYNVFAGIIIAIGILIYSRIGFTLSLVGFYSAYFFYQIIGASLSEVSYSYIGFNYILTAIAVGGYFIIPNRSSYLWTIILIPMVAIITISLSSVFMMYQLPVYSLPFNLIALLFLYILKFRVHNKAQINTVIYQQNSPERNLYSYLNLKDRFEKEGIVPIQLPFFGNWVITQGHEGEITHKGEWKYAWDFEIKDEDGKTFKNSGDFPEDYYCYNKAVIAPADGIVEEVVEDIPDNIIGEVNLEDNWGNTIIIKHSDYLYSKLSHLKPGSIDVKKGDKVKKNDLIAKCGNTGRSPVPHLHFQIQETPYIGSKTLDYPISNYIIINENEIELKTNSVPKTNQIISNITVNSELKKAFHLIPGKRFSFDVIENEMEYNVDWEVKQDKFLNQFIECNNTSSKAYFKTDGAVLFFTHFSGDKTSLLYFFYLAAFKVGIGYYPNMKISDSYPVNQVFSQSKLFLQDFIAPFILYLKGEYELNYEKFSDDFSETCIKIKSNLTTKVFGRAKKQTEFGFEINKSGLKEFTIVNVNKSIKATCLNE